MRRESLYLQLILICVLLLGLGGPLKAESQYHDNLFENRAAAEAMKNAVELDRAAGPRIPIIEAYKKVIELQPEGRTNVAVANRIAQLYAFYQSPNEKGHPDPKSAAQWWEKAKSYTDKTQLIWYESSIGIASTNVIGRKPGDAIKIYHEVLAMDTKMILAPKWKALDRPFQKIYDHTTPYSKPLTDKQRLDLEIMANDLRLQCVDALFYASLKMGLDEGLRQMAFVQETYPNTPLSEQAKSNAAKRLENFSPKQGQLVKTIDKVDPQEISLKPPSPQSTISPLKSLKVDNHQDESILAVKSNGIHKWIILGTSIFILVVVIVIVFYYKHKTSTKEIVK